MANKEDKIQMQIVTYLRSKGYTVFSVPNEAAGKIRSKAGLSRMQRLKAMGLTSGASDLVVLGEFPEVYFLEVKDESGRQSENQKKWEAEITAKGWTYLLYRSLFDVMKVL